MPRKEPGLGDINTLGSANTPSKPAASSAHTVARRSAPVVAAIESPPPAVPAAAKAAGPHYQSAKLLGVSGRTRRVAFINITAYALLMIALALGVASTYADAPREALFIAKAGGLSLVIMASLWLLVSVGIRRLHDMNRSGLWLLTVLIPAVNTLLFLMLVIWPGHGGGNQFGAPSQHDGFLTWVAFFLVVLVPIGLLPAGWIFYDTQTST
jgi:uncharacterized membrane protein YhaH (DUF805 family)